MLIVQESNLLRRITIFKMMEIIASVVVRYYQFMASINFLAFSIKHFSIQHWRIFVFGFRQNGKVRDVLEDGTSKSLGIFRCCLGYRASRRSVASILLHTQSLELSIRLPTITLWNVSFWALADIPRTELRPRLVTLGFDGSRCLGLRLFITLLVFAWNGSWVVWVVESRRLSTLPPVNIAVIFCLSELW